MSSQYFDTSNHKKFQCDFAFKDDQVPMLQTPDQARFVSTVDQITFMDMDWKSISQDLSDANVANIWSSLDLYRLLTCNQFLIKSNPNEASI
jgi:hypothetical protein